MADPVYIHATKTVLDFPALGAVYAKKDAQALAIKYGWRTVEEVAPAKPTDVVALPHWQWVASCAAKKDVRYYINQVFVTPTGLWATDGHAAHWAPFSALGAAPFIEAATCRISSHLARAAKMSAGVGGWITGDGLQWGSAAGEPQVGFEARMPEVFKHPSARDFTPCAPCPDVSLFKAAAKSRTLVSVKAGVVQYLEKSVWVLVAEHLPAWHFSKEAGPRIDLSLLLRTVGDGVGWSAALFGGMWCFSHADGRGAVIMPMKD